MTSKKARNWLFYDIKTGEYVCQRCNQRVKAPFIEAPVKIETAIGSMVSFGKSHLRCKKPINIPIAH